MYVVEEHIVTAGSSYLSCEIMVRRIGHDISCHSCRYCILSYESVSVLPPVLFPSSSAVFRCPEFPINWSGCGGPPYSDLSRNCLKMDQNILYTSHDNMRSLTWCVQHYLLHFCSCWHTTKCPCYHLPLHRVRPQWF